MCCGRLDGPRQGFFPDASPDARLTVPVSCFLVRHPKGTLLFDTGVACGAVQDPIGVLGKLIASYFKMAGSPNENVVDQLATQGLVPDDITHVACSHLHFDHCGCNRHFPRAKILMQRAEMDAAREPGGPYSRRLWDLSLDYQFLEGEHDVFGDGTVMLFPTPGHTAGHQSAIVRTAMDRRFVLAADACYTEEHLKRDIISPVHWHEQTMRESMEQLRRLSNQAGTELVFGHDQEQWQRIEAADGALA
jgi:glyoxylase-like metal-dependent hydrolase (beta-lactamase superfamily II)